MYSSVGPDDSVRPNTRLPYPHFVLILSFRASAHTGVGIRSPRPLPLPLGEVAERSEDGEGKQSRTAFRRFFFAIQTLYSFVTMGMIMGLRRVVL